MATPIKDAIKAQQAVVLPDNVSQLIKPLSARNAHNFGWNAFTNVVREDLENTPILNTHIADNAVTTSKVADTPITEAKLATGSVGNTKIKANGVKTSNVTDLNITKPKLSQAVQDQLDAVGGGTITNNPDDEDIETVGSVLKFKDRTSAGNQKGYKIIRQDFDFTNIPAGYDNSIWIIAYEYDLGGANVALPENVTLKFNGGFLGNFGILTGNNTIIEAGLNQVFSLTGDFDGTIKADAFFPQWWGAVGDGVNDDTSPIQKAISLAAVGQDRNSSMVRLIAGRYKTTGTITIPKDITLLGDGLDKAIIDFYAAFLSPAILVDPGAGGYIWGMDIGGFKIECGNGAVNGHGMSIHCNTPSAISQSKFHDLQIRNCTDGIQMEGVLYMLGFSNMKIVGIDNAGIITYGTQEIIYNSFRDIEVTEVHDGAYAYNIKSPSTNFSNLTCDGCCVFNSAYGHIDNLVVEGISAAVPANTILLNISQVSKISNTGIINVPNAKCSIGMYITTPNINIDGIRVPSGGGVPSKLVYFDGTSGGVLQRVQVETVVESVDKIETYINAGILEKLLVIDCEDITDISNVHAIPKVTLPVPSQAFNGNLFNKDAVGGASDGKPVFYIKRSDGGFSAVELVGYDTVKNVMRVNTELFSGNTPSAIRNSSAASGKYWNYGPFTNNAFLVENQDGIGVSLGDGATAWGALSDIRYKTDLRPIENGLEKINSLRSMTGRYKTDKDDVSRSFLIAQDLIKVLPEAVEVEANEEKKLSVRYSEVVPLLVAALKDVYAELEELKKQ